jgi:hypothetical protein
VNPNGIRLYWYPFQTLGSESMHRFIHEWFSPDFHDLTYLPLLLMLLALMAGLVGAPRCPRLRNLLLVLATIPAALRSMRHIPILVLVIVPVLSEMAQTWLQERGALRWSSKTVLGLAPRTLAFNLIVLLTFAGFTVARVRQVVGRQGETETRHFPAAAAAFLQQEHPPGPMMNHYNWGGYFIWTLYPQYRVFWTAGPTSGDTLMNEFGSCYHLKDDWRNPSRRGGFAPLSFPRMLLDHRPSIQPEVEADL